MVILGLDPGSRKAGWAVIEMKARSACHLASGVFDFTGTPHFIDRLHQVAQATKEVVQQYRPKSIALESLVFVKNVNSLAKLSQARGAMIAALGPDYLGKVFEYSPNLVKSTITGHGHADKQMIERAVRLMLFGAGANKKFHSHDESDALAIALCHGLRDTSLTKKLPAQNAGKNKKSSSLASSLLHKI